MQRINPWPVVGNHNAHPRRTQRRIARRLRQGDRNLAARAAIFDPVLHEVGEDLTQLVGIAGHRQGLFRACHDKTHPRIFGQRTQRIENRAHEPGHIHRIARADPLLPFDPAERQKIAHQPVHPVCLFGHDP